jgi:hypothetical protein
MKESIRKERQHKLKNIIDAAVGHLENSVATLEDANLYTDDTQEHDVDTFVTRLEDIIQEMRDMYNTI